MEIAEILKEYKKYNPFEIKTESMLDFNNGRWAFCERDLTPVEIPDTVALAYIESVTMEKIVKSGITPGINYHTTGKVWIEAFSADMAHYDKMGEEHENRLGLWKWFQGLEAKDGTT